MKTKYNILIIPIEAKPYTITLETDNLEWSMLQYGRNREAFAYEIIEG
jgi:hypothetical protein|tara:strand:+ start:1021 stop:1164 length:144 start_codon:yes stop_codon:yes gene_type:complete